MQYRSDRPESSWLGTSIFFDCVPLLNRIVNEFVCFGSIRLPSVSFEPRNAVTSGARRDNHRLAHKWRRAAAAVTPWWLLYSKERADRAGV
jgi:hypothetical protein